MSTFDPKRTFEAFPDRVGSCRTAVRYVFGSWSQEVRALRLYEQEPREADASARFGAYVRRWAGWATSGLTGITLQDIPVSPGPARR